MARVIYVPSWLQEVMSANKVEPKQLYLNPIVDMIPNRQDLLSFLKAQQDFVKFLVCKDVSATINMEDLDDLSIEDMIACNIKAKDILFKDNWPTTIDEVRYALGMNDKVPYFELLHLDSNATSVEDLTFSVVADDEKPIIFVYGSARPAPETTDGSALGKSTLLMREILRVAYRQQNIHTGHLDHASIVKQNEILTFFYVSGLSLL